MKAKNKLRASIVAMFVLVSAGLMLFATPARATEYHVYPGDCIQVKVDLAGSGDTVIVHPGTYHQSVVFYGSDAGITLKGLSGAVLKGTYPKDSGCDLWDDAIEVRAGANNITIEGFEITEYYRFGTGKGNAVQAWNDGTSYIAVKNNVMHGFTWQAVLVGNAGTGLHDHWTIEWNAAYNFTAYGLELTNAKQSVIAHNTVSDYGWTGIMIQAREEGTGGVTVNDVDVYENYVSRTGTSGTGIYVLACSGDSGPGAFCPGTDSAKLTDVSIYDNHISGGDRGLVAYGYFSGQVTYSSVGTNHVTNAASYGIQFANVDQSTISGNEVAWSGVYGLVLSGGSDHNTVSSNIVDHSGTADVRVRDSTSNTVKDNILGGSTYGVYLYGSASSTDVKNNNIQSTTYGVYADISGTSTHILQNTISDSAKYGIYMKASGTSPGVSIELNSVDTSGEEGIYVDHTLDTVVNENYVYDSRLDGILAVSSNLDVTWNVLDDTPGISGTCNELNGIRYQDSSGTIDHNTVVGTRCLTVGDKQNGIGITGKSYVNVTHNDVSDFGKRGIVASFHWDAIEDHVTALVSHNNVTGDGPISTIAQNGIQMQDNTMGHVKYNTVKNFYYTGPIWAATGILLWSPEDSFEVGWNDVDDAQIGIYDIYGDYASIHDNTVDGASWGIGIDTETGSTVKDNTIGNMTPTSAYDSYGIDVWDDTDSDVLNNDVSGGYDIGIAVEWTSQGTLVKDNTVDGDFETAVLVDDSGSTSKILVDHNTATGTSGGITYVSPLTGILVRDSKSDVSYNTVTGVKGTSIDGKQIGIAIDGVSDVDVLYNAVSDYGKGGIYAGLYYDGTGDDDVTADVRGNTVTGRGSVSDVAQNGIVMIDGTQGNVSWNIVSNHRYGPATDYWLDWTSTGIMDYGTDGVKIENNTVDNNQAGMVFYESHSSAFFNRVLNSEWGIVLEWGCVGCVVAYNTVTSQSSIPSSDKTGIMVADDDSSLISMNTVSTYNIGISVIDNPNEGTPTGSLNTVLRNNTVSSASTHGIRVTDSTSIKLYYNIVRNGYDGVYIDDSEYVTMSHNHVLDNSHTGVNLDVGANHNDLDHNVVTGNTGGSGVYVQGDNNNLNYNIVSNNYYGIKVDGDYNYISRNTVNNNLNHGIWATSTSNNNYFVRNTARNNGGTDCRDEGTFNTWTKNNCGSKYGFSFVEPGLMSLSELARAMVHRDLARLM